MADLRRFDDDETAEILARAASAESAARAIPGQGFTLAELQEIGREVGIAPERVAQAASVVVSRRDAGSETLMGLPRAHSLVTPLAGDMDEDHWGRLVVALRDVAGATGTTEVHGPLRAWRHGDLEVLVEPAGDGTVVRMQARNGDLVPLVVFGPILSVMGLGMLSAAIWTGEGLAVTAASALVTAMGAGMMAWARWAAPRWLRRRARQMEDIAAHAAALFKAPEGESRLLLHRSQDAGDDAFHVPDHAGDQEE